MITAIFILIIFVVIAVLIALEQVPTVVALPVMAVIMAIVAGMPLKDILSEVIEKGAFSLHEAYVAVMIGSILAQTITKTGIAKTIIKLAAELAGDQPFFVAIALSLATAFLFQTLFGTGAVIMVGTIVLPIMMALDIPAVAAAGMFLIGFTIGSLFNLATWKIFSDITGINLINVLPFAYSMAIVGVFGLILFIAIEFNRAGVLLFPKRIRTRISKVAYKKTSETKELFLIRLSRAIKYSIVPPKAEVKEEQPASLLACLAPVIPIVLVLVFSFPILSAFLIAIIYSVLTTSFYRTLKENSNLISASVLDGIAESAAPVALMIGIGMLIKVVMHPSLMPLIQPALLSVIPANIIGFVLFFIIFCPLALYRGPLTFMGLGGGIAKLLISAAVFPASLITCIFVAIRQMTASTDPTNTQVVWTASFCKIRVTKLMLKLLPYTWVMSALGIIIASVIYRK